MIQTDKDFYYQGDTIKGKALFRPNKALDVKKCYIEIKGLERIYYKNPNEEGEIKKSKHKIMEIEHHLPQLCTML